MFSLVLFNTFFLGKFTEICKSSTNRPTRNINKGWPNGWICYINILKNWAYSLILARWQLYTWIMPSLISRALVARCIGCHPLALCLILLMCCLFKWLSQHSYQYDKGHCNAYSRKKFHKSVLGSEKQGSARNSHNWKSECSLLKESKDRLPV